MGTNFYLRDKLEKEKSKTTIEIIDKNLTLYTNPLLDESKDRIYAIIREEFHPRIHIGKTSFGWKPIFQSQEGKFTSVEELKEFYSSNINELEIIDKYGEIYTWDEFDDRVLKFGQDGLLQPFARMDNLGYYWTSGEFS